MQIPLAGMDITPVFKASVRAVKTRKKSLNVLTNNVTTGGKSSSILQKRHGSKNKTHFMHKAKEVVSNISKLKDFLLKYRKEYINITLHDSEAYTSTGGTTMTNEERDRIDSDAEEFIKLCSDTIHSLRVAAAAAVACSDGNYSSKQMSEHREAVISLAAQYLKVIVKLYSEQKAIRVKKVVDQKTMVRLQPSEAVRKKGNNAKRSYEHVDASGSGKVSKSDGGQRDRKSSQLAAAACEDDDSQTRSTPAAARNDTDFGLSAEEIQMLEQENEYLYDELNSVVDEVRNIEGKVVEISKLQEIFTDKVLEQDQQIESLAATTVTTSENIKEGNEQVRKSIEQRAGIRVYILFFLIIMSFALLFLDWYNP